MRDTLFRARGTWIPWLVLVGSTACDGVSLEVLEPPDASSNDVTTEPAPDVVVPDGGCAAIGVSCTESSACCSGLCGLDGTSRLTCRPTTGCVGLGAACTFAGQCCSLACSAPDGTEGTCIESPLCGVVTTTCSHASDCCSNVCMNGMCAKPAGPPCAPAGEACKGDGDCCGSVCQTASDETLRCALLQACRVMGEVCGGASDCCSGICTNGRCAAPMACNTADTKPCMRVASDICMTNMDCCSRVCVATAEGARRCAPIGGCAPLCERCEADGDCCSNSCTLSGDGIKRCASAVSCGPAGEVCTGNAQCCTGGLTCVTDPTSLGAHRCESASTCVSSGACAVGRDCCGGECLPTPMTCASTCVADNQRCTTRTDCCNAAADDCLELNGALTCAPVIH